MLAPSAASMLLSGGLGTASFLIKIQGRCWPSLLSRAPLFNGLLISPFPAGRYLPVQVTASLPGVPGGPAISIRASGKINTVTLTGWSYE